MHIVNAEPLESDIIEEQVSLYYKETKLDIIEV